MKYVVYSAVACLALIAFEAHAGAPGMLQGQEGGDASGSTSTGCMSSGGTGNTLQGTQSGDGTGNTNSGTGCPPSAAETPGTTAGSGMTVSGPAGAGEAGGAAIQNPAAQAGQNVNDATADERMRRDMMNAIANNPNVTGR